MFQEQYEFLYKAIAQTFALECQPYHKVRLQDRLAELKKFDHNSGKSKLEVLYDVRVCILSTQSLIACHVIHLKQGSVYFVHYRFRGINSLENTKLI